MAAVVRSWVRIFCPRCDERRTFLLGPDRVLVCTECGLRRSLGEGVLLREDGATAWRGDGATA